MFYYFDERRIIKYFEQRESIVQRIDYKPFLYGWIGSRNPIYSVAYVDKSNNTQSVLVKTGFLAGVYISDTKSV